MTRDALSARDKSRSVSFRLGRTCAKLLPRAGKRREKISFARTIARALFSRCRVVSSVGQDWPTATLAEVDRPCIRVSLLLSRARSLAPFVRSTESDDIGLFYETVTVPAVVTRHAVGGEASVSYRALCSLICNLLFCAFGPQARGQVGFCFPSRIATLSSVCTDVFSAEAPLAPR